VKIALHEMSFYKYGLRDLHDAIMSELGNLPWLTPKKKKSVPDRTSDVELLTKLLRRFHVVVRQLRRRYNDRDTLVIQDEYDVQDLLHALLRAYFDDVRAEEYTPSYAGGASRLDFLVKEPKIVVETKIATVRLKDKQIGEQLLVDIGRYRSHPDCRTLICFVYDPEGHLRNPAGLSSDLTGRRDEIDVVTVVNPI
jgi:hypothetical protein